MDHRVQSDRPGLNPDSSNAAGDGSSYLRQLKSGEAGVDVSAPGAVVGTQGLPSGKERRRSVRYRCSGSVDFRSEGSDIRMWGTLTDVSLHGCYVEMNTTFPVGTKVDLNLEAMGIRVHVQGTVRVSYPFLGMGIMFTEIEPGQQIQLGQVLAALSGQGSLASDPGPTPAISAEQTLNTAVSGADPRRVVDEVRQFFVTNRLLSREEFLLIAKRASRS